MKPLCPSCLSRNSLEIAAQIELPPDCTWDEVTLQVITCPGCGFEAAAIYTESRRGALDSEVVDHRGYFTDAQTTADLKKIIAACPNPADKRCDCPSHRLLGEKDNHGCLTILADAQLGAAFLLAYD